jgi:hypothetical protein
VSSSTCRKNYRSAHDISSDIYELRLLIAAVIRIREKYSPIDRPQYLLETAFNAVTDCIQDNIFSLTLELARTPSVDLCDLKAKVEALGEWCGKTNDTKSILAAAVVEDFALLQIGADHG